MHITDVFKVATNAYGQWCLVRKNPTPTTDALLTSATQAELEAYFQNRAKVDLGLVWDGVKRVLASMPASQRAAYAAPADRPEMEFDVSLSASPESINSANTAFWNKTGRTSDTAPRAPKSIAEINAQNRAFWDSQPTFRYGAEYGKG